MDSGSPRVSVGVPVYNGARYLSQALEALLSQTYTDLEIIVSDNSSTDRTEEIVRDYTKRDPRVRYYRHGQNVGAARNFSQLVHMARGEFFKWAAHDDLCAPELVARCVAALDGTPDAALCYSRTQEVDASGVVERPLPAKPRLSDPRPHQRLYECICVPHAQVAVFGLIRRQVLLRTGLIGAYASSDRVLLGELALQGRLIEVPEFLFQRRIHPGQGYRHYRTRQELNAWYDPAKARARSYPHWRLLIEHARAINRAPIRPADRALCYGVLTVWVRRHWRYLAANLAQREPGWTRLRARGETIDGLDAAGTDARKPRRGQVS